MMVGRFYEVVRRCEYCNRDMTREVSAQSYLENPFCRHCVHERLEEADSLMEPTKWVRSGDYLTLVPLSETGS